MTRKSNKIAIQWNWRPDVAPVVLGFNYEVHHAPLCQISAA